MGSFLINPNYFKKYTHNTYWYECQNKFCRINTPDKDLQNYKKLVKLSKIMIYKEIAKWLQHQLKLNTKLKMSPWLF